MIIETVVGTVNADASPHLAPLGVRNVDGRFLLAPFYPSTTLANLRRSGGAVVNLTDDVRVFAGCLTGRRDWPTSAASAVAGTVLNGALSYHEVEVERVEDDPRRPRFFCRPLHSVNRVPFGGLNRAKAAVLEAAILVSRLDRLPADKIDREIDYLRIAVEKTAGPEEREAWGWLLEKIAAVRG